MNKTLALILSLFIITALTACTAEENEAMDDMANDMMEESQTDDKDMMDDEMGEMMDDKADYLTKMGQAAAFQDYTEAKFDARLGSEPVALFFHASWCPTCLAIDKEINANLSEIPEGTTILVADYDEEVALKQELGVTTQSTLIFFDASGTEVERLNGAQTFGSIKAALEASL